MSNLALWSRPAWDILFIIDFSFTAILLIPQLLAWAYEDPEHSRRRALIMWLVFTPAPFVISRIAQLIGDLKKLCSNSTRFLRSVTSVVDHP